MLNPRTAQTFALVMHELATNASKHGVDDQPVVGGIDLGDAGVMALEADTVWSDDAVKFVQRREADRALARGGQAIRRRGSQADAKPSRPCSAITSAMAAWSAFDEAAVKASAISPKPSSNRRLPRRD